MPVLVEVESRSSSNLACITGTMQSSEVLEEDKEGLISLLNNALPKRLSCPSDYDSVTGFSCLVLPLPYENGRLCRSALTECILRRASSAANLLHVLVVDDSPRGGWSFLLGALWRW